MAKVRETKIRFTDYETGEIKETIVFSEMKKNKTVDEPLYLKMYLSDLCKIKGLTNADYRTLSRLAEEIDRKSKIRLTEGARQEICDDLGITRDTLRKRLPKLTKANLIKLVSRNDYMVNPEYFSLGNLSWKEVCENREVFKLEVIYKSNKSGTSGKKSIKLKRIPDLKVVK